MTSVTPSVLVAPTERSAVRRRPGALWALCHLGDAAVQSDINCSEVLLPSDYLQVCGRWQCRDPQVDYCFFSGGLRDHEVAMANESSNESTSLPLQRTFRWRPDVPLEMPVDSDEEKGPVPVRPVCRWPRFPLRRWPKSYENLVERQAKTTVKSPRPATPARSCPEKSCCRRSQPFFRCDSDSGAYLSRIWHRFGDAMVSKLLPSSRSGEWQHCADEGQICLCLGEVRFGLEAFPEDAADVAQQWASETLVAKNGLVFCTEETFGGQSVPNRSGEAQATRVCQCHAVSPGPLVVPSNETRLISADNVSRSSARAMSEEGRFIRSQPYSDDFLNGVRYDYASMHAGARLVTHAKGLLHAKAVLSPDKSLYMLSPCETRSWFVISLLEDIFVEYVGLVTLELFASGYRHLQILGSNQYPTETWRLLGEIESNSTSNYELFDVGSRCQRLAEECWVRFLKIRVLSHHRMEDNSFCALTRFQVFGATATNYIAKERTAEDRRDRRVDPSLLDIARWHEEVARAAALPPSLGQSAEPLEPAKDSGHSDSTAGDENKEAKSYTDLPLALIKDVSTWLRSKVLHRPAVAPPEDDSNASAPVAQPETKPPLSDMLVELNVSTPESGGSGLASLEKLQATLDSLAAEAPTNKAKKDSSMPALVAINKELREMQESQAILQEHNKHVISCLNTMLALVVQLFTEQNARMKTLEERTNDGNLPDLPDLRHSWWPIERPYSYGKNGQCQGQCPEEQDATEVPGGLPSPLWEQLQVLLYYPLDRILLILISVWLLLSRISSAFGRSSISLPSPEVEVHEVNSTPSRSKGSSRHASAKKDRDETNRTVSGASGRRLQRELQRELRDSRYETPRRDTSRNSRDSAPFAPFRNPHSSRVRRRSRSADRAEHAERERDRSSSDSSRTDVQRKNLRAFELLCQQLPQTPPLHPRTREELRSSGDELVQKAWQRHLRRQEALGEVDSSSPRHRNTDTAPSSSDREDRDEAWQPWQSRISSELGGEVPELPHFKAHKRRAPKRYSSAARRHPVHLAARRPDPSSPVTGPAESQ